MTITKTIPADSTERLRLVADTIEAHPEFHNQSDWFVYGAPREDTGSSLVNSPEEIAAEEEVHCGTTACIAGWSLFYADKATVESLDTWSYPDAGAALLDLHPEVASKVFFQWKNGFPRMADRLRALADFTPEVRRTTNPFSGSETALEIFAIINDLGWEPA